MRKSIYISLFLSSVLSTSANAQSRIITTIAGNHIAGYSGNNGPATAAALYTPNQLTVDAVGNVYIAETRNHVVRKISTSGIITVVAGNNTAGYAGDGGPATAASLDRPSAVCYDISNEKLYISELGNNCVRVVDPAGNIATYAGNTVSGYGGDGGPATSAALFGPYSIVTDKTGNLYIADAENQRVRKVDMSGNISTVAGKGVVGYSGDGGQATNAELKFPIDVALDKSGNLYIADINSNVIRKVDGAGVISTIAGKGVAGYTGDGKAATSATLRDPYAVCVDTSGNIFITDNSNQVIRMVDHVTGIITTIAGDGVAGYSGDGGPATAAEMQNTGGIKADTAGNIFIADYGNNVIRKVSTKLLPSNTNTIAAAKIDGVTAYPNPINNFVTLDVSNVSSGKMEILINDVSGKTWIEKKLQKNTATNEVNVNTNALPSGTYFITVKTHSGNYTTHVVKQ